MGTIPSALRSCGYLALGALPLAYAQVPFLPVLLRSLVLLAAGAFFALAMALETGPSVLTASVRRAGAWAGSFLAFQALSALWGEPRWAALAPVLNASAALAAACGIATDPHRGRGLALAGIGPAAALALYAANLASGGGLEHPRLQGSPVDHLPFGNHNTAALLLSACLPFAALGVARRKAAPVLAWGCAAAGLAWMLWRTGSRGALLGLAAGGVLALALRTRRTGLLTALAAIGILAGPALAWSLSARLPRPDSWRLTTTFGVRVLIWESALNAWKSAPCVGHGSGSFPLVFPQVRAEAYPLSRYAEPLARHAYNLPLQTLAETGLAGALLGAAALAALLAAWKDAGGGRGIRLAAVVSAGALMAQALGGDTLVEPLGLACFALAAALALPSAVGTGAAPHRSPSRGSWALLALVLAGALGVAAPQARAFADAHAAAGRGEEARAEAGYARAASGLPCLSSMDARFERGGLLLHLGRDREALEACLDLLALAGPYGNARAQAALAAAVGAGRKDEAIALLEAHLASSPCDVRAIRLLASLDPTRGDRLLAGLRRLLTQVPDGHPMIAPAADWLEALGLADEAGTVRLRARP